MRITRTLLAAAALVAAVSGGTASALSAEPCPPGYYGVVVEHDGRETQVCNNLAYTSDCPSGDGTVVHVGGRYVSACLRQVIGS